MQNITKPDYSLVLELLPEFGWSIGGSEPAYSPGSVFQGSKLSKKKGYLDSPEKKMHADANFFFFCQVLYGYRHHHNRTSLKQILCKSNFEQ